MRPNERAVIQLQFDSKDRAAIIADLRKHDRDREFTVRTDEEWSIEFQVDEQL